MKRMISVILALIMIVGTVQTVLPVVGSAHPVTERRADPATLDGWKNFFGEDVIHTGFSGTVWSDKSVLTDPSVLGDGIELTEEDNFTVALSALASDTFVKGYDSDPADTVFILDSSSTNKDTLEVVSALNKAIADTLEINEHNRIGVVAYSGNYTANEPSDLSDCRVLLPIGRYTHDDGEFLVSDDSGSSISVNSAVKKENGASVPRTSSDVKGASYVQGGIYTAMNELLSVEDTVIPEGMIQAGTLRVPVMVLISAGAPNVACSVYDSVASSDMGNGIEHSAELDSAIPFVTQLTASYADKRVAEHYDSDMIFYTLSLGTGDHPVVDPKSSSTNIDLHWQTYTDTPASSAMHIFCGYDLTGGSHEPVYLSVIKSEYELGRDYVNSYFRGDVTVKDAFGSITEALNKQTLHYPTYVDGEYNELGGYIEFIDDIGQYMEVKRINGIKLGGVLYTGESLARNFREGGGELGSIDSPNVLGNELIWSVMERLGITDLVKAQDLITRAYRAKQLYYDIETGEYSNYIGWYADADGNYISHASEQDSYIPENAVYFNRSYGFTGVVSDSFKATDMMYVSVQVHTRIATGTSAVIFRVPAVLIPVIRYEVTMTGENMSEAGEIELSYDNVMDVDTTGDGIFDSTMPIGPIRLIYEVGLKQDIDEISVHELVSDGYKYRKDGEYTFYTNRWNTEDLEHEHPSLAENTVAFFTPSETNERYYFTRNTPVYQKQGEEYVLYKGAAPVYESGKYYRAFMVFEYSDTAQKGNAIVHTHYEELTEQSLKKAEADTAGGWYIPKGTIHRYYAEYSNPKSENITKSLEFAHYPGVEMNEETGEYYIDYVLGNNGYVKIKAAQGIKISQQGDDTMYGFDGSYCYEISGPDGSYRQKVYAPDGSITESGFEISGGKGSVVLKENEIAYIIDLPEDTVFNVRQLTEDTDYTVGSVNGMSRSDVDITVDKWGMKEASFINTLRAPEGSASFILRPVLIHPFDADTDTSGLEFVYNVSCTDADGNGSFSSEYRLGDTESVRFDDIPLGSVITVEQLNITRGFSTDKENNTFTFTADEEKIYPVVFTNTYSPDPVENVNVTVKGDKTLTGREWEEWRDDDEFEILLQKRVDAKWVDLGTQTVNKNKRTFDFTELMKNEVYDRAGEYSYRIREVYTENPYQGIHYDKSIGWFDVVVGDSYWNGVYEIDSVIGYNGVYVSYDRDHGYEVKMSFANSYSALGTDSVSIFVELSVEDLSGSNIPMSAAGREFGLYQGDTLVQTLPAASAAGESVITLTYGSFDLGNHIKYTLKEIPPEVPLPGMKYSTVEYTVYVSVYDDHKGGIYARVATDAEGSKAVTLSFTDVYDPEDARWTPEATLELEGRDILDSEFTVELYRTDESFTELDFINSASNIGNTASFDAVSFDKQGRYCYVIKQLAGGDKEIAYDNTEYRIIIDVTDVDGRLVCELKTEEQAIFRNVYTETKGSDDTEDTSSADISTQDTLVTDNQSDGGASSDTDISDTIASDSQTTVDTGKQTQSGVQTKAPTTASPKPSASPQTGDAMLAVWLVMLTLSASAVGVIFVNSKKRA